MKLAYIDLEQAESRVVGAIGFRLFGETAYLDACESGDLHSLVCRMAWTDLSWPEGFSLETVQKHGAISSDLLDAAKKIAEAPAYREKSYRDLAKILGHGCLTGDHEVLTPTGWVKISSCPSIIMQYTGRIFEFSKVSHWVSKEWKDDLISVEGVSISLLATTDHRIIFTKDKKLQELSAEQFLHKIKPTWKIPLGEHYKGGTDPITPEEARLVAAYQADGEVTGRKTRFHFHKERKVQRLRQLASDFNVKFTEYKGSRYAIDWSFHRKNPGAYMLNWSYKSILAYIYELKFWDGHRGKTSVSLFSKHKKNLEWIQTLGRLCGIGGNIHGPRKSGFGTNMYSLQQNFRKYASGGSCTLTRKCLINPVQVYCPTVPSSMFLVRRNGKIHVTGNSNYYGKPPQMSKHSHIDVKIVKEFQRSYFDAFPEIPRWHRWVAEQIQTKRQITTVLGRRRFFFGRPDDDKTLREAIAYEPQSVATGDYMNYGLLQLWKANLPIHIFSQVHDAVSFAYDEQDEDWIIDHACSILESHFTIKSPDGQKRDFSIPTETFIGWNLSHRSNENPDGLIVWKGSDDRERSKKLLTKIEDFKL